MARFTPPALHPGPRKKLSDELYALHRRAGWPSVRDLSRALGVGVASYSRIHDAFTKPRLPAWGLLQLLVVELAGRAPDVDPVEEMKRFHRLWDTAAAEAEATAAGEEPLRIHESHGSGTPQHDPVQPGPRAARDWDRAPNAIKRVLIGTLADLYPAENRAEELLEDMGFPPQSRPRWDASQEVAAYWRTVVLALELGAMQGDGVGQLLDTALGQYPGNANLRKIRDFLTEQLGREPVLRRRTDPDILLSAYEISARLTAGPRPSEWSLIDGIHNLNVLYRELREHPPVNTHTEAELSRIIAEVKALLGQLE
ncbi:hypothetical protein QFZ55_000087 [Streptomyces luteogriseus]|uniref:effector-associated domain EAD1-containing protein n=1 Tax=Streptomyces luteogriseus TaxID=68233 RepID=UPI00278B5FF8|nr:effector-associated domain EAD1-containing protein [Streptomyces luteogriseus]MDQ0710635.1 hypothetical protein [Streptomyces luteogriseus]